MTEGLGVYQQALADARAELAIKLSERDAIEDHIRRLRAVICALCHQLGVPWEADGEFRTRRQYLKRMKRQQRVGGLRPPEGVTQ